MGCCKSKTRAYRGSELKMLIGFEYIGENLTLDNIDFDVEYYCRESEYASQKFTKRGSTHEGIIVENGQAGKEWFAIVDTSKLDTGTLMMKLTAYIPLTGNIGTNQNYRKEIGICETDVMIVE